MPKYLHDNETDEGNGTIDTDDELLNVLAQVRKQLIRGDYRALDEVWKKYGDSEDENPPPKPTSGKTDEGVVNSFIDMLGYLE